MMDQEQMAVAHVIDNTNPPDNVKVVRGLNGTTITNHTSHIFICSVFTHLDKVQVYPGKEVGGLIPPGTETDYEYDLAHFGDQTKVTELGLGSADINQQKVTETAYQQPLSTDPFIVVPKSETVYPPGNQSNVLALTDYYYDGATSVETKPTLGNLTAVVKQATSVGSPTYSAVYSTYNSYGSQTEVSEPRLQSAATAYNCGSFPNVGCVPPDVAKTVTTYDSTYPTYPIQIDKQSPIGNGNPVTETTTFTYDYALGKITSRTEPSGRTTHVDYDTFGRPTEAWDNYNSETHPTKQFIYDWSGTQGYNSTTTLQSAGTTPDSSPRTARLSASTVSDANCRRARQTAALNTPSRP